MKKRSLSTFICSALLMSFLLGSYNGRLALWKGEDPTPCKVFPCPIIVLPGAVQEQLRNGIRLETIEDVNRLLKQYEMMQSLTKQFAGGKLPKHMRRMMGKGGKGGFPGMGAMGGGFPF